MVKTIIMLYLRTCERETDWEEKERKNERGKETDRHKRGRLKK